MGVAPGKVEDDTPLPEGRRFMVLLGLEILSVFPAPGTGWHLAAGRQ